MPAEPVKQQVAAVRMTDRELRKILRDAAAEAERIIAGLEPGSLRATQIELARLQVELWADVESSIRTGVQDAAKRAARMQALIDNALLRGVPAGMTATAWRSSLEATARAGVDAYLARRHNRYTLSERVYRNRALSRGMVERTINNGLLLGKSPAEIAKDVRKFIGPDAPGGVSYSAMRLGRTEVVNAYHARSIERYQSTPWVERAQWNVSGSHPKPDVCDEYAEETSIPGGEPGVYRTSEVPDKPHPQCLCYITPITVSTDQFVADFHAGKYDSYIDGQLANASVA